MVVSGNIALAALAGHVAVTAGCAIMYVWGSLIISIIAYSIYCLGSYVSITLPIWCPPWQTLLMHLCSSSANFCVVVLLMLGSGLTKSPTQLIDCLPLAWLRWIFTYC